MKSEVRKIIEKSLGEYETKEIRISGKGYTLYIVPDLRDEDLNIFEGFLFADAENKSEISYLKSKYRPPVSGYAPRIGLIFYEERLLIKDYRRNKHIIKTLKKINKNFINKLKKALAQPTEENFNKLFDRTDVIEEFYILFKKSREYLLENISGIAEEEKREEFVDNFMMQMLTLWYLQERGFFNNDTNYFITKFNDLEQKKLFGKNFKNYYDFLTYFFEKISNNTGGQYYSDNKVGKVVVVGPAVFINGEQKKAISIPDECFYRDGLTNTLINTPPKKVGDEVPLLNLFESRDWTEGNIDEFVLGAIYEKLITYMERKKLGAYYTPEEITSYICKNTIEPYLVDRVNEEFNRDFETVDQIIESNDKEILLYLFDQLKEIKILDPAVGSGHFLESAINVLLSVYEKIWEKAKEIRIKKGLIIKATDEKGEIKEIELLDIGDKEKFRLLVKFFIILSKNIYGVDINPSALKVARARLFLTLAKHFKVGKEGDLFVRFPNVHFNLRDGNSLIGYVNIEVEKPKNPTLFDFDENGKVGYVVEKIKVVDELKPYLEKTAKSMDINGNIVKEVETLNEILSKKSIGWNDFMRVLKTKEKLIKILIASLNSQYAVPLNELLREITNLFNQKLDEKFAEEHNIDLKELKKIKTFHWFFEFPEVFLDRGGFDVVVGNPPYGNILTEDEKRICKYFSSHPSEIASVFVERTVPMNKNAGYFSFIITYAITFSKDLSGTRKMIYNNYKECYVSTFDRDKCRFFDTMTQSVSIILCKKKTIDSKSIFYTSRMYRIMPEIEKINYQIANDYLLGDKVGVSFSDKHRLPKIGDKLTLQILKKVIANKGDVKSLLSKKSNDKIWVRTSGNYWYNAWDRNPYEGTQIEFIEVDPIYKNFLICLINSSTYYLWFRIYGDGRHMNSDIMNALLIPPKEKIVASTNVLSNISERLMRFLFYNFDKDHDRFITSNVKPIIDLCDVIIGKLYGFATDEINYILNYENVIRGGKKIHDLFYDLLEHLLFDCQKGKNIWDYKVVKSLLYEIYFKEKFAEDGLYPEPKEYLLETISRHLSPINYDRWAELYWKKQLDENLTPEEEKELETLEKENLKTINEVYNSLASDKEIQEWIEKIKSHPWVKVIEEKA